MYDGLILGRAGAEGGRNLYILVNEYIYFYMSLRHLKQPLERHLRKRRTELLLEKVSRSMSIRDHDAL